MARAWIPLMVVVLLAGCSGDRAPVAPVELRPAPDFALAALDGRTVRLSDFDGEVRLVDFWATWCAPCKEEIPWMIELHRKYGEQGFRIVAIDPEEGSEIVRAFVEAKDIPYTNLAGEGDGFEKVKESFGVFSYPTAFLVDAEGNIVAEFRGTKSKKVLERKIRELLGLPPLA